MEIGEKIYIDIYIQVIFMWSTPFDPKKLNYNELHLIYSNAFNVFVYVCVCVIFPQNSMFTLKKIFKFNALEKTGFPAIKIYK